MNYWSKIMILWFVVTIIVALIWVFYAQVQDNYEDDYDINWSVSDSIQNIYGIYVTITINESNNWTDRDHILYLLAESFKEFPINVTVDNQTRIYESVYDIPLEDDCFESQYNESCFIKYEVHNLGETRT